MPCIDSARMQEIGDEKALRRMLKDRHVHYTVDPEWIVRRGLRRPVGFEIRLFAAHEKGARALPGCRKSRALAVALRSAAQSILPPCAPTTRIEAEPFMWALYDSREVPGSDEVAVAFRVLPAGGGASLADAPEERCLKTIRERLKEFAVPER